MFPKIGSALLVLACAAPALADGAPASRLDQVLDAVVAHERELATTLERHHPLVETYLQTVKPDPTLGSVPVRDHYFFGRLQFGAPPATPATQQEAPKKKQRKNTLSLFEEFHSQTFRPEGFARMLVLDRGGFDRENYAFDFVRAEFLGEVRTLVFDVAPKPARVQRNKREGGFTGRIWVEDREYHVVRYNGVYASLLTPGFHFDCWRMNLAPGLWLPAYVYTEEAERASRQLELTHRGQTRIWGYDVDGDSAEDEFTKVLVEDRQANDAAESAGMVSPLESARAWQGEAEANVIRRLERSGLLAPPGEVDRVLETVVGNLEVTNQLQLDPPVRCRVLLTTPLESFTVGRTIVLSRGLIDVLPDEASLAMVLAHELGHVLKGHRLDTRYAFGDRVLVGDRQALEEFVFERDPGEEAEADEKAVELLAASPYKDKLAGAGLFLKALSLKAANLPSLIRPHFGNRMANHTGLFRMGKIVEAAPELDFASLDQTAALPLGSRVKVDPWSAKIELMKTSRAPLLSAREKMPFQITPLMPYLARHGEPKAGAVEEASRRAD